jgi:hypothetical protein
VSSVVSVSSVLGEAAREWEVESQSPAVAGERSMFPSWRSTEHLLSAFEVCL